MKCFIQKLVLFFIISVGVVYLSGEGLYWMISKTGKNFLNNADYKVTEAILRSRKHKKVKKLVLGDSVCASLYGDCHDSVVYCLAATVAITPVGHYLLCANFLENNKEQLPEEVVLILNPLCWTNTMTGGLFYSTFTKNFFNDEFKEYLDKEEVEYLNSETYGRLCNYRWYQLTPYVPELHNVQDKGVGIAPIQYKYTMKIKEMCESKGISFRLLSGPMRESIKERVEFLKSSNTHFSELFFKDYFASITYMPDDNFLDQLHLRINCVPNDYFNLYE